MLKTLKILLKSILFFVEFLIAFLFVYLAFAVLMSIIPVNTDDEVKDGIKIYVKTNGVHTDVCIPVISQQIDWTSFIPVGHFPKVKKFEYVSIGWGDKGFLLDTPTWDDLTFSTAFNAAFLPSETAMHVAYFENEPIISPSTKQHFITESKYADLIRYIKESFKPVDNNSAIALIPNKGYWSNDNFYEAKGSYHLFNTCNAWTNKALKIAGVRTAVLALFSDGIMRHLK